MCTIAAVRARAEQRDHGRAEAGVAGRGVRVRDEIGPRVGQGTTEQVEQLVAGVLVAVERGEVRHRDRRRDVARSGAAHAVGEHQQVRARVAGVLVVLTQQAHVGAGRVVEGDDHRYRRSSMTVCPTRIGVPIGTWTGPWTCELPSQVPLVEPRSSTYQTPSEGKIRACRVEE